jgi:hypothetical protein
MLIYMIYTSDNRLNMIIIVNENGHGHLKLQQIMKLLNISH